MIAQRQNAGTVLVKAKGGMGNRLLCAATGVAYGMLTDRVVVVDWSDGTYSDDGSNVFSRYFDATGVDPSAALPLSDDVHPSVWREHLHWSVSRMLHAYDPRKHSSFRIHRKYSADPAVLDHRASVVVIWAYTHKIPALKAHIGCLPGEPWPPDVDGILRRLLQRHVTLRPELLEQVESFRQEAFGPRMIGVHVRHSDRVANVDRYVAGTHRVLRREPGATVFVATDNQTVLERFRDEFPRVVATEKWYPDAGASMHQNDRCPDRFQNGVEALLDIYLLARCDWLLYPRGSTFSYVSALLSDAPAANLIDLERFNLRVRTARLARALLS